MFLACNGHLHHVQVTGPEGAPVLVLLHSLGTCGALWHRQIAALSGNYRIIAPDFRGHGLSAHSRVPLTCEALAEDVLALLAALDVDRFALAGVSLGGVVAQIVAARAGNRVSGLAIIASYLRAADPAMWQARAAQVRAQGLASIAVPVLSLWVPPALADGADAAVLRTLLEHATDRGYADGCDALALADCSATTPHLTCPTLVVSGAEDRAVPPAVIQRLADAIPGCERVEIPGAGHLPVITHAEICTALLRRLALPRRDA